MPTSEGKLRAFLDEAVPSVNRELYAFLPEEEPADLLYLPMRDYPGRGGKRFRPALVLLVCEALGGDPEDALRTAAAFEMLQSFLLVHDDIEDGSEMRRGKPCLHRIYGVPLALNVGDALYAKVFEILLSNLPRLGSTRTFRLLDEMVCGTRITCEGQAYDLGWVRDRYTPTAEEFIKMLSKKTGWYSGRGPCEAGAIIANADDPLRRAAGNFGESLAIAFQIRDDLLNLTVGEDAAQRAPGATEGSYGKERGGDIEEGKRTLMIIDLLDKSTEQEGRRLLSILDRDRSENTPEEVNWVIAIMERYGSIQYAKAVCEERARQAIAYLDLLPSSTARDILSELGRFLIERTF